MAVYTVHAPVAPDLRDEAERFVFVRDGFHTWAMLLGPLWLVWHRLWLVLIGYLVINAAVAGILALVSAPSDVRTLVFVLIALLMGLEAASLRRWSYSRRKWQQIDFVVADDEEKAERRFFDRWTNADGDTHQPPSWHVPTSANQPRAMPATQGIIGLFPEPGGSR